MLVYFSFLLDWLMQLSRSKYILLFLWKRRFYICFNRFFLCIFSSTIRNLLLEVCIIFSKGNYSQNRSVFMQILLIVVVAVRLILVQWIAEYCIVYIFFSVRFLFSVIISWIPPFLLHGKLESIGDSIRHFYKIHGCSY